MEFKNSIDGFVKTLYAAAEMIRHLNLDENDFKYRLLHYYQQYCNDNPNGPKLLIEKFDDYLYRWAMKVWPRAFDIIYECSRNKHA